MRTYTYTYTQQILLALLHAVIVSGFQIGLDKRAGGRRPKLTWLIASSALTEQDAGSLALIQS